MSAGFAKKVGMTRLFLDGKSVAVTVIEVLPSYVLQTKNLQSDGYKAVQLASSKTKKVSKAALGHISKSQKDTGSGFSYIAEFKDLQLEDGKTLFDVNDFDSGILLKITGVVKGRGFAGVVKRHGFHGQPASHGHDHERAAGSIGSRWPQRVVKGRKMAGRMGNNQISLVKVQVLDVDKNNSLLFVKGSMPGANGSMLKLRKIS